MDIKELLNRTMQCPSCAGAGIKEEKSESTSAEPIKKMCEVCNGTGIVLDSFITDLMIKNGIKGKALVEFAEEIYKHYEIKLEDSYNRGIADGKDQVKVIDGKGTGA